MGFIGIPLQYIFRFCANSSTFLQHARRAKSPHLWPDPRSSEITYAKDSSCTRAILTLHPCGIQLCGRAMYYREYDIHLTSRSADLAPAAALSRCKTTPTVCKNSGSHVPPVCFCCMCNNRNISRQFYISLNSYLYFFLCREREERGGDLDSIKLVKFKQIYLSR